MNQSSHNTNPDNHGATVVITHHVHPDQHEPYENWLGEIVPFCKNAPGYLDLQLIRPILGLTSTYTVVIRFDARDHLETWMHSSTRKKLIEKIRPSLAKDDHFSIRSGLDFWFVPEGTKVPAPWKQWLVTWSAIYPLSLGVPLLVLPLLRLSGLPSNRYWDGLVVTGVIVLMMVTLVMPHYTRGIRRWFFK